MKRLGLLVLLAACGPKPAPAPLEVGNDEVSAEHARTPCPDADRLAALGRSAFGETTSQTSCKALWAGEPLWLIDGYNETEDGVTLGTVLTTTDGAITWSDIEDGIPWGMAEAEVGEGFVPVDLDGDGDDEVLDFGGSSQHGYSDTWVRAYDVRDQQLFPGELELSLGNDNTAAVETEAEYEGCYEEHALIAGPRGGQVLEVTRTPLPTNPCDNLGRHVYAWDGHDLKELP